MLHIQTSEREHEILHRRFYSPTYSLLVCATCTRVTLVCDPGIHFIDLLTESRPFKSLTIKGS